MNGLAIITENLEAQPSRRVTALPLALCPTSHRIETVLTHSTQGLHGNSTRRTHRTRSTETRG